MNNKKTKTIAKVQEAALTPQNSQGISIEDLINKALENKAAIATVERIFAMRNELKAEWAKEEFNKAMAAFQAECPIIAKTKGVPTKSGAIAYKYAPIETLDSETKALRQKHGFSYKTDQRTFVDGAVTMVKAIVTVTHQAGHSEQTEMTVPLASKTEIMSQSQVVAAAYTFAKRYAFKNAFGIIEADEDNEALLKQGEAEAPTGIPENITEKMNAITDLTELLNYCKEQMGLLKPELHNSLRLAYTFRKNEIEAAQVAEDADEALGEKEEQNG